MTHYLPRLAVAALAALTAGAASAAPRTEPLNILGDDGNVTVRLYYSTADAHTARGAKDLAFRIRVGAAEACGGDSQIERFSTEFQRCQSAAIDRATRSVNAPLVADALGRPTGQALARR